MDHSFKECRKRLATLWLITSGILFLLMIAQTFGGALGSKPTGAWGWFLPNVMPTLMLVASSLVSDANGQRVDASVDLVVDRFYYRSAMGISAFYLSLIFLVLLGWRATAYESPVEVMNVSALWIAPIQGLTASIISIFFRKSHTEQRKSPAIRKPKNTTQ